MILTVKKSFKLISVTVAILFSSSLYSLESNKNCSDIFIQIPYSNTKQNETGMTILISK